MSLFDTTPLETSHEPILVPVVEFYAHGMPRPQGSKRAFVVNGRAVMTESNKAGHRDWRATVNQAATDAMAGRRPLDGPLAVTLTFAMPRPKSHPKGRRTWATSRPDADKLARNALDAMTHVVMTDDARVVDLRVRKVWALIDVPQAPGVHVTVHHITGPVAT